MKAYSLNYKDVLKDYMPVTFDSVDVEEGHEVERMWLADFVGDKWVEDYVMVKRYAYDTIQWKKMGLYMQKSKMVGCW